jgi:hypothetical protein
MSINWDKAVKDDSSGFVAISSAVGRYNDAAFIGFTDTWVATGKCYDCDGVAGNKDCRKCKGTGQVTDTWIALKYDLGNGSVEQEKMTFKISEPLTFNGKTLRSSKLYDRLLELSGLVQPSKADLQMWAKQYNGAPIPCTVKIEQPGKYPKITVVLRNDHPQTAVTSRTMTGHELPGDMRQRMAQNAATGPRGAATATSEANPFDDDPDDELPF